MGTYQIGIDAFPILMPVGNDLPSIGHLYSFGISCLEPMAYCDGSGCSADLSPCLFWLESSEIEQELLFAQAKVQAEVHVEIGAEVQAMVLAEVKVEAEDEQIKWQAPHLPWAFCKLKQDWKCAVHIGFQLGETIVFLIDVFGSWFVRNDIDSMKVIDSSQFSVFLRYNHLV